MTVKTNRCETPARYLLQFETGNGLRVCEYHAQRYRYLAGNIGHRITLTPLDADIAARCEQDEIAGDPIGEVDFERAEEAMERSK